MLQIGKIQETKSGAKYNIRYVYSYKRYQERIYSVSVAREEDGNLAVERDLEWAVEEALICSLFSSMNQFQVTQHNTQFHAQVSMAMEEHEEDPEDVLDSGVAPAISELLAMILKDVSEGYDIDLTWVVDANEKGTLLYVKQFGAETEDFAQYEYSVPMLDYLNPNTMQEAPAVPYAQLNTFWLWE